MGLHIDRKHLGIGNDTARRIIDRAGYRASFRRLAQRAYAPAKLSTSIWSGGEIYWLKALIIESMSIPFLEIQRKV
jgi:hypothetical protein